jgi:hypothetical protein
MCALPLPIEMPEYPVNINYYSAYMRAAERDPEFMKRNNFSEEIKNIRAS